jgi:uncharacterized protein (DUF58 family)
MQSFIDPITLSRVKDLPLIAKRVARGFLHGCHASQQRGSGVEFNQYRSYEPGDALAQIDWKLFARSDKYFVREAERESDINVWLVLDASASMQQISEKTAKAGGWNKLQYAKSLLATIAYLAQQQGDAVGLLGLSTQHIEYMPPLTGQKHWQRMLVNLQRIKTGGEFPEVDTIQSHLNSIRRHGLVFVVSDFYQHNNELMDLLSHLTNSRTDVVAVQLETDDEINFPYRGQIRFQDLETQQQVRVSAHQAKQAYLEARQGYLEQLQQELAKRQVQLLRANIDQPLDQTLYDFLSARQQLR